MSGAKFTPGPWRADPCDGCQVIITSDDETVATVHGGNDTTDTANAALIAAAPDLYAALKEARDYIAGAAPDWHNRTRETLAVVDSALAKAESRS